MTTDSASLSSNSRPEHVAVPFKWVAAVGIALGLVASAGLLHGLLSNRWGVPVDVKELGQKLREIPLELGPWRAEQDEELHKNTVSLLECEGYIFRIYQNTDTSEVVSVAVLFGPKGPIAVHTPEVCYRSQDVNQTTDRKPLEIAFDGTDSKLWKLTFETKTEKAKLNVLYGWSDGGPWYASNFWTRFWPTDYLYKIQTASQSVREGQDSTTDFLRVFLPELRKRMLSKEG